MTCRIIADLKPYGGGEVSVEQDLVRTKLRTVTDIHIDETGMATLALFATDGIDLKVEISDITAEAILRTDARRQLSFLTEADAAALIDLNHTLVNVLCWHPADSRLVPLNKMLRELERRSEIPF